MILCGGSSALAQRGLLRSSRQRYTLSGYLEPSFRHISNSVAGIRTSSSILSQDIRANLRGYLLDDRIFTFSLGSRFINHDLWFSSPGGKTRISSRNAGLYNFRGTILPRGRHPLSFFSSLDRTYSVSSVEPDTHTDFRVHGAALSLNYISIPRLSLTVNRTTTRSNSDLEPRDESREFFEVRANQSWEAVSRLWVTYRAENRTDNVLEDKHSTRSLRMDGQTTIDKNLLLNGVLDYYRFDRQEVLSGNARVRFRPSDRFLTNGSFTYAEENDGARQSWRQGLVLTTRGWVRRGVQLTCDVSGARSVTLLEGVERESSDITFRPGYDVNFTRGKAAFTHGYTLSLSEQRLVDSLSGRSVGHFVRGGVTVPLSRRYSFVGSYAYSHSDAQYSGGTSDETHRLSSTVNGRVSPRVGIQSQLEHTRLKTATRDLVSRRNTYSGELRANVLWKPHWSSIFGLRYRRHENSSQQDLLTVYSKLRYVPSSKLSANCDVTYSREAQSQSADWVGDLYFDYTLGKVNLAASWKLRHHNNQFGNTSNEVYIKVRRSFDHKLK